MTRFLPALLLAVLIVVAAPFLGLIRDAFFDRFEASAVRSLALALGALAAAVFLYAVARIRDHRLLRYAGLVVAATLVWLQGALLGADLFDSGITAQVNVVEKIHLIEYGLLVYLLYRAVKPAGDLTILILPLLWLTLAGVLDEGVQWLVETRVGEIRDVFINIYAGVCGLVFSLSLDPPRRLEWRLDRRRWRRVSAALGLALLPLGLFFNAAHLGYEHEDPEIGRFRTWHTLDELSQAAAERSERWKVDPPTGLSPWRREDFYLTEAAWHATHRNERLETGDLYLAAQANRILEKYYDPFLDLESFRGSGKHRYPPEVRRDLEARAPRRAPKEFTSLVLIERVYPWPSKRLFFAALIPAVLLIWLLPWLWPRRNPKDLDSS